VANQLQTNIDLVKTLSDELKQIYSRTEGWRSSVLKTATGYNVVQSGISAIKKQLNDATEVAAASEKSLADARQRGNAQDIYAAVARQAMAEKNHASALLTAHAIDKAKATLSTFDKTVAVAVFKEVYDYSAKINVALAGANTSLNERRRIIRDVQLAQIALGASTAEMASTVSAMASSGLKLSYNFKDTLETSIMMQRGLGTSVGESLRLANTAKSLGISYKEIGNVMAGVVTQTSLAADEATRYANALGRALGSIRSASGGTGGLASFRDVVQSVSAIESVMKERNFGEGGGFAKLTQALIVNQNNIRGNLGVRGQFQGSATIDDVLNTIKTFNESISRLPENIQYQARQNFAQSNLMGMLSPEEISKFDAAFVKSYGNQLEAIRKNSDLTDVYTKQMTQAGEAFTQVKNSVTALIMYALTPVAEHLNTFLTSLNTWIATVKDYVASVGTSAAVVGKAIQAFATTVLLVSLGGAIRSVASTIIDAIRAIRAQQGALTGSTAAGVLSGTAKTFGGLVGLSLMSAAVNWLLSSAGAPSWIPMVMDTILLFGGRYIISSLGTLIPTALAAITGAGLTALVLSVGAIITGLVGFGIWATLRANRPKTELGQLKLDAGTSSFSTMQGYGHRYDVGEANSFVEKVRGSSLSLTEQIGVLEDTLSNLDTSIKDVAVVRSRKGTVVNPEAEDERKRLVEIMTHVKEALDGIRQDNKNAEADRIRKLEEAENQRRLDEHKRLFQTAQGGASSQGPYTPQFSN